MLDEIAAISETPASSGVTRVAFTKREREAHALVEGWFRDLGLEVRTDTIGNTIAERPGRTGGPAIGTGSHLDSVPRGGRFDGIAGVVAAVEAARLLGQVDLEHDHPVRFVVFAGEEGARFGQACIGSKGVGGMWTPEALAATRDAEGTSIFEAMSDLGLHPDRVAEAVWSPDDWAAFIELHVEQGQVLEQQGVEIGIVDLISGSTRFEIVIDGRASHTGSTPMNLRADALAAAAEVVLLAESIAKDPQHRGTRCTIGKLDVDPGSITTIPGRVRMWVDVRDVDSGRQRSTANEIVRRSRDIAERRGVRLEARLLSDASPVVLPVWIRDLVSEVCRSRDLQYRVMFSGASHDSQMVNNVIPAGMIFVPSRHGLSHVPGEWTSSSQIALGVDVLVASLLALDTRLTSMETTP
jgi:allantoate deiminase